MYGNFFIRALLRREIETVEQLVSKTTDNYRYTSYPIHSIVGFLWTIIFLHLTRLAFVTRNITIGEEGKYTIIVWRRSSQRQKGKIERVREGYVHPYRKTASKIVFVLFVSSIVGYTLNILKFHVIFFLFSQIYYLNSFPHIICIFTKLKTID